MSKKKHQRKTIFSFFSSILYLKIYCNYQKNLLSLLWFLFLMVHHHHSRRRLWNWRSLILFSFDCSTLLFLRQIFRLFLIIIKESKYSNKHFIFACLSASAPNTKSINQQKEIKFFYFNCSQMFAGTGTEKRAQKSVKFSSGKWPIFFNSFSSPIIRQSKSVLLYFAIATKIQTLRERNKNKTISLVHNSIIYSCVDFWYCCCYCALWLSLLLSTYT